MGKSKPPAPPDPRETSAAQTGTNVSTTIANSVMGMVDQTTPYGSLSYNQTGEHSWTDPYTGETYSVPTYEAITQLTPEQQGILSTNFGTQQNLADMAFNRSAFLEDYLQQDPTMGLDALDDRLFQMGRQRIDPRMAQQREALHTRLANQGIVPGSEAYNREMALFGQNENDAYNQLALTGRDQAMREIFATRNQPINEIIGLLSGTQVQNPNVQMSSPSAMPITDNAGLINANYDQRLQNWQIQNAQQQSILGGLFGLAGNIFSDMRVKTDIEKVGEAEGLNVYRYRYLWDEPGVERKGFMAQEVMHTHPQAVVEVGGVLALDYSQLPGVV